jgi:hypothetical protein
VEHARHPDVTNTLLQAAGELPLTERQRTALNPLESDLEASGQTLAGTLQSMKADVANQVRDGRIDLTKDEADEASAAAALRAHANQEIDALNTLHTLLEPAQRSAAVAAARSQESGFRAKEEGEAKPAQTAAARLDRMTRELGLDADQQQRVSALIAAQPAPNPAYRMGADQNFDDVLNAFGTDTFDARVTIQPMVEAFDAMIRAETQRTVAFLSSLLPILRTDQRATLATRIESVPWNQEHGSGD